MPHMPNQYSRSNSNSEKLLHWRGGPPRTQVYSKQERLPMMRVCLREPSLDVVLQVKNGNLCQNIRDTNCNIAVSIDNFENAREDGCREIRITARTLPGLKRVQNEMSKFLEKHGCLDDGDKVAKARPQEATPNEIRKIYCGLYSSCKGTGKNCRGYSKRSQRILAAIVVIQRWWRHQCRHHQMLIYYQN